MQSRFFRLQRSGDSVDAKMSRASRSGCINKKRHIFKGLKAKGTIWQRPYRPYDFESERLS